MLSVMSIESIIKEIKKDGFKKIKPSEAELLISEYEIVKKQHKDLQDKTEVFMAGFKLRFLIGFFCGALIFLCLVLIKNLISFF